MTFKIGFALMLMNFVLLQKRKNQEIHHLDDCQINQLTTTPVVNWNMISLLA